VTVLALLDHSRAALPTDHTWETAANWLLTAWAEIAVGHLDRGRAACTTALAGIERLGDRWGQSQAEAILGGLAQAEQAYDVAVAHLSRAATAAQELGFRALEAHHRTTLGQVHQQADDLPAAEATLRTAVDLASACADLRTAALARVELGRVLLRRGELDEARALATTAGRWYDAAGGGDGAALAATLLATLDAER
jgi:tetratricopeptide (TPR) repeat protein